MKRANNGKRRWKQLAKPQGFVRVGQRVVWHFIMSYTGDGRPGVIVGEPYQTGAGDWLVPVKLDDGREIKAAVEALDEASS